MRRAARTQHAAKLRPVLLRPLGPAGEGDRRAVHSQQPAAPIDEILQALPQLRIGKQIADGVIEEHGIELAQRLRLKDLRVAADDGLVRAGRFAHPLEGQIGVESRRMSGVSDIHIVDQQSPRTRRSGGRLLRQRLFDLRTLRRRSAARNQGATAAGVAAPSCCAGSGAAQASTTAVTINGRAGCAPRIIVCSRSSSTPV